MVVKAESLPDYNIKYFLEVINEISILGDFQKYF